MAVKVYHAKKTLQLLDILRGWPIFDFGGVIGRGGCSCRRNRMAKNLKRRCCKHTFSQIDGEAIGGQSFEKSLQMEECVFACPESRPVRRPYMQTHLPNHLWCSPSFSEMFHLFCVPCAKEKPMVILICEQCQQILAF
jgi:hypothetical protein